MSDERVDAPSRVIKRYANRKLYDTHASRYVTLHQIAEYVKAGDVIRIVDNTTKEDLTRVTLAQILYERERQREPEDRKDRSLREMLREGRERLLETILEGPMGKLVHRDVPHAEPVVDGESMHEGAARPAASAEKSPKRPTIASPREAFDELGRMADEQWRSILDTALGTVHQLQGEVQRLHSRIEELEGRIGVQRARAAKKDEETPPE